MTAYSMTITNSVRSFGGSPPSLWNAYNWAAFKWGEGTAKVPMTFRHLVTANPIVTDSARYFRFTKYVNAESFSAVSTVNYIFSKGIGNTLSPTSDSAHQYVTDPAGYYRVFPGGTTDAETRVDSSWTKDTGTTPTWTQDTASSTTWSVA